MKKKVEGMRNKPDADLEGRRSKCLKYVNIE